MKEGPKRTTRIALRCTPTELKTIDKLAKKHELSIADFIRQSIIIALAGTADGTKWRHHYNKALETFNDNIPWSWN